MNLKSRLFKIETQRPNVKYPSFSDMHQTQTKATYDQWLLDNNSTLTQSMIDELSIKSLEQMY